MGNQYSGEIKYMYANINGNSVSIPYIRLSNGSWMPLEQYNQSWYLWNAQRTGGYVNQNLLSPTVVANHAMYPLANQ